MRLMGSRDFGEDVGQVGGPGEGAGRFVVFADVVLDGLHQRVGAGKRAASDALDGDFAEPAFDDVQP